MAFFFIVFNGELLWRPDEQRTLTCSSQLKKKKSPNVLIVVIKRGRCYQLTCLHIQHVSVSLQKAISCMSSPGASFMMHNKVQVSAVVYS